VTLVIALSSPLLKDGIERLGDEALSVEYQLDAGSNAMVTAVDSVYQAYGNGTLLGGVGDFEGSTPVAHGYHYPRLLQARAAVPW
jgi:hypothetical protein